MTYQELYQDIITPGKTKVSFPYSYEDGEDLIDCYNRLFHQYINLLSQVDKDSINSLNRDACLFLQAYDALPERELDVIRDAKELSEATLKCVCTHLAGYPSEAYCEYKDFFAEFSFYHFNSFPRLILHPGKSFYRVRNKEGLAGKYGELFHIPFEMRSKVSAERFSIPGLPALYLSGSLITACMETGVKKEDTFAYSRFENVSDLEFIDLSIFNKPIEKDVWEYFSFLVNYPLIMACHIPVKCPSDPFKPEYCIPQTITQIVRCTNQIAGIAYLSAKQTDSKEKGFEKTNFIVPTNYVSTKSGYCESLINYFNMTCPIEIPSSLDSDSRKFYEECNDFDGLPLVTAHGTCKTIDLPFESTNKDVPI